MRQAEARLGERASAEQGSRSLPLTEVDISPGDADTKKGLKNTKKNIVKNNLESLQDVKESVGKSQVHSHFALHQNFVFSLLKFRLSSCSSEHP